jgi:hypothetical protein
MLKPRTISCRGALSLFGFGATLFAIPTTDAEAQTSGMARGKSASNGVTSGAEASPRRNSPQEPSPRLPRRDKNNRKSAKA